MQVARTALTEEQASHESLRAINAASLTVLNTCTAKFELSDADLLVAHASLALHHDLTAELSAQSTADKVHLEQRLSQVKHENTSLQVKYV